MRGKVSSVSRFLMCWRHAALRHRWSRRAGPAHVWRVRFDQPGAWIEIPGALFMDGCTPRLDGRSARASRQFKNWQKPTSVIVLCAAVYPAWL
jgi:hypothetical protein